MKKFLKIKKVLYKIISKIRLALFWAIKKPFRVAILLSIISILLLLPLPLNKQKFWFWGYTDDQNIDFQELVKFDSPLQTIIRSIDFPSRLKFYDVHFEVYPHNNPVDKILEYRILVRKDKHFYQYAKTAFNNSKNNIEVYEGEKFDTFILKAGDKIIIQALPIDIPISYSGYLMCASTARITCPDISDTEKTASMVEIFARPNLFSLFSNAILIFALWIVVINSLGEIIHKKWKKY